MPTNADDSPIFITGVSRGLGRALIREMIEAGRTIIGCARNETAIHELRQAYPAPHQFTVVDIGNADLVQAWIDEGFAELDNHQQPLLINNAGQINANANLWDVPPEEFAQVAKCNINGTYHTIRAFVPHLLRSSGGGIINFSSTWGSTTSPEVAPYCATKWAIEGLTQALASELPEPYFAVALNPGVINTDMLQSCFGESANGFPSPDKWAQIACPMFLRLSRRENGNSLRVPL